MLKTPRTPPYEKPTITRQVAGIANKFGLAPARRCQTAIDGVAISSLLEDFGSPLFVFSEKALKVRHKALLSAFSLRYPKVRHAWSYKTNYLKSICRVFHDLGSWAEVVSPMEYDMARALGVPPHEIIFNGPYKPKPALFLAASEGAMINVDSMDEIEDLASIAAELGRDLRLGIRLNMSLGTHHSWDRYGFNIESGAALEAARRVREEPRLHLVRLHSHIGTFVYDPEHYRTEARKLAHFHNELRSEFGVHLDHIDIGGGFASRNRLKGHYLSTSDSAPSFDQYADAICEELLNACPVDDIPTLILESGRAMVDEAGYLLSSVVATKRSHDGKRGIVIDAGVNLLFTAFWYDHEIIPAVDRGLAAEEHIIYGPLCMQIDVVREKIRLPNLRRGDPLIIRPVGAYNNTQWMQFITLRPAVVMIRTSGEVSLIRTAETVDYLQQPEMSAEWSQQSLQRQKRCS